MLRGRHVSVANFTIRIQFNIFRDPLFYLCLFQNHLCGKSQADPIIVHREILKRFKQIRDFSICTRQACY